MAAVENIPKDMEALWYESATKFDIRRVPVPEINDEEVLVRGKHPPMQAVTPGVTHCFLSQSPCPDGVVPTNTFTRVNST